jgi:hypothetical protein
MRFRARGLPTQRPAPFSSPAGCAESRCYMLSIALFIAASMVATAASHSATVFGRHVGSVATTPASYLRGWAVRTCAIGPISRRPGLGTGGGGCAVRICSGVSARRYLSAATVRARARAASNESHRSIPSSCESAMRSTSSATSASSRRYSASRRWSDEACQQLRPWRGPPCGPNRQASNAWEAPPAYVQTACDSFVLFEGHRAHSSEGRPTSSSPP